MSDKLLPAPGKRKVAISKLATSKNSLKNPENDLFFLLQDLR
jgi:hypothetical protein